MMIKLNKVSLVVLYQTLLLAQGKSRLRLAVLNISLAFKMDHILDHNTKEDELITYGKKSVNDPANEFYKRTSRRVF